LRVNTGRDGTHIYFFAPLDKDYPKDLAHGVDIKCVGGYVVAPPRSHEAGHEYTWENWGTDIAHAPEWLLTEIRERKKEVRRYESQFKDKIPEAIIQGGRDIALTSMAGKMRRGGFVAAEILAALTAANSMRCKPPLDDRQVTKIAASVSRYEPAETLAANGIAYVTGEDLARPLPPVDYISQSLGLTAGSGAPHCFGGYGFSGKTVIAQAMLLALANGKPLWRAFQGPKKLLCVSHVDNEQGIALTQRRYQRLALAAGISLEEVGDRLRVFIFPKTQGGERIYLCDTHRNAWIEIMTGRDLVVIDSFAASRQGTTKENEAEVRRGLDMLGEASELTGCRALIIHHATKDSGDDIDSRFLLRGSGGIFDALDSVYMLAGQKGEPVKVEHIKARSHGEPVDSFAVVIHDIEDGSDPKWGLAVTIKGLESIDDARASLKEAKTARKTLGHVKRLREALKGGKRLSKRELQDIAGLSGADCTKAIESLKALNELTVEEVMRGHARAYVHFLT
jgi:RecA-family ATPase